MSKNTTSVRFEIFDVFAERQLEGNQLAVVEAPLDLPETLLLPLAHEIGFSETVFVTDLPRSDTAAVRIFTPGVEIPFAGHPVLGTAAWICARSGLDGTVMVNTRHTTVDVEVEKRDDRSWHATMEQPWPETVDPGPLVDPAAFGIERVAAPTVAYDNGARYSYVELESPEAVAAADPDLGALAALDTDLVLFAPLEQPGLFKARMFAPAHGISEDPATGSAAGPLAVYLTSSHRCADGAEIQIKQGTELGRPSLLKASAELGEQRVSVAGSVFAVGSGTFELNSLDEG